MLTFFAALIAIGGVIIELHPRIKYSLIEQLCIVGASMTAGGYVMGQNDIALFYCVIFMLSGLIYHAFKVFYHVIPQEKSSVTRRR